MENNDLNVREIFDLHQRLKFLGYEFPKFGSSSEFSYETENAIEEFLYDHNLIHIQRDYKKIAELLKEMTLQFMDLSLYANYEYSKVEKYPKKVKFYDLTNDHPRSALKRVRSWKDIKSIVLHQTGIMLGNSKKRFTSLKAHIGIPVLKIPTVYKVYPFTSVLWHANDFNSESIGIEINGSFEGIDGKINTAWKGGYKKRPHKVTRNQIVATRTAILSICKEVSLHGGDVNNIFAHRQSSKNRIADPGSKVWNEIGVWAQDYLGLSDGGEGFCVGGGRAIPNAWDENRLAEY